MLQRHTDGRQMNVLLLTLCEGTFQHKQHNEAGIIRKFHVKEIKLVSHSSDLLVSCSDSH